MTDPMLVEYVICRAGYGDALLDEPLFLSAEAACRRDPAKFFKLAVEVNEAWKAYYAEEMVRRAQIPMPLVLDGKAAA